MTSRFSLKPFPGEDPPFEVKIDGTIGRSGDLLSLDCAIRGTLSEIELPPPAALPERRDRLWEGTCLELFLAEEGSGSYREFNLSPTGHWNVYRFASYRKGMREEEAFASLPFHFRRDPEALRLSLDLDLGKFLPAGKTIEAAVCAVVRSRGGGTSRWALAHPAPSPDFHRRDGFGISLPGG